MNGLLAPYNPFDSALASAMTAGSATAPDLSDPSDAVAANSVSAISAEGVAIVASVETSIPAAAVAPNSELAGGPVVAPRQTESFAARSLGPGRKKDQASFEPSFQPDFKKLFSEITGTRA